MGATMLMEDPELFTLRPKHWTAHPDDVVVECDDSSEKLLFTLQVNPEDKGRIIGRKGVVAQSIRSLLRVAAVKEGVHAVLEIQ